MIWYDLIYYITFYKKIESNKKIPLLKYYWNTKLILRNKKQKQKQTKLFRRQKVCVYLVNKQYWCSKFYLRKDFANFTVLYELNVKIKYLFIFKGWKIFDVDFVEISATRRAEHCKSVYCLNCRLNFHGTFCMHTLS